ncbi:hypothetical protein ACIBCO_14775 [Streptomyces violascens]|uniref:hypothetical protein n=1 Tax=Streptomyces violascens TaxID=67381 RepID=UPI0037ADA79C
MSRESRRVPGPGPGPSRPTATQNMGCGLLVLLLIMGLVFLVKGVIDLRDGSAITCGGRTLHPGDTCRMHSGNKVTERTYEEMSARWDKAHPALATGLGAAAVAGSVILGLAMSWRIERGPRDRK